MLIAEQIVKIGMSAGTAFTDFITNTIREYSLMKIIETGSYMGTGTTAAIRAGMPQGAAVYSIEVNPDYHIIAKKNNEWSDIHFVLGLSVPHSQIPLDPTFNVPDTVVVDHHPHNRNAMYRKEVSHKVPDRMLYKCLEAVDFRPDMVILDSAGHMGWIEFQYLMQWVKGDFILCLDDTNHVKHYDTYQYMLQHPKSYEIIFHTDQKFGSCAARVSLP